jgi:two-component system CheB/CheR fusion protein
VDGHPAYARAIAELKRILVWGILCVDMPRANKRVKGKKDAAKPSGKSPATGGAGRAREARTSCPVVGFGASAGGLEAFSAVLQHMPANTGMALVLIPHLDPQHASILADLLTRETTMDVTQVTAGTRVRPNHVYVIPPNKNLAIEQGTLRLEPREPGIPHMPVDRFFRSLADDQAEKAIGVVLSGTASDGSQGIRAIKAAGGITFVQEPATAQYDGMPRSAIATGCVDAALSPEGIARELVRLRLHPYLSEEPKSEDETEAQMADRSQREIFNQLRNATGVDFSLYKPGTVHRRMLRRMALLQMERLDQYARYIRQHPEELPALFQDILINVTSFFREPATFEALKARVFPAIFKNRTSADPVRVWVPGCATGEEVYSVGICLFEYMRETGAEMPVQIFGTDLSEAALERARAGVYPATIEGDVSPERLGRFFVRINSSYQIARSVRDSCIFARQNVTKDPPFSKCDLILCRNLLIYLGPALQNTAMRLFHYALQPHGYLVLGLSESTSTATNLFDPTDKKLKIYIKIPGAPQLGADMGAYQVSRHVEARREPAPASNLLTTHHRVDQMLLARYSPAALVVDSSLHILEFRGHTAPYLEHSAGQASLELAKMTPGGLGLEVQHLIRKAHGKTTPVKGTASTSSENTIRNLDLTVLPIQTDRNAPQQFVVVIEEQPQKPVEQKKRAANVPAGPAAWAQRVKELEQELAATREYLQTVIEEQEAATEELKSAHEEVQSGNEELQSTNEELLTAKEELQSTNEELTTVNEEMQGRNNELQQANNDLLNLLSSVNIPILMLGNDLRIRRFTPQAEKLFNLLAGDIGRPASDLRLKINMPDVVAVCDDVLDDLTQREREVQDSEGRAYSMWIRPYRTAENRIDGVVLALFDVTERKQTAEARYRRRFEAAADGIVIADADTGVIVEVNPFILKFSGYPRNRLIGATLWESPLFEGSGLDESVLEQLHETESMYRTISIRAEAGQSIETDVVCNIYTEGDRKVAQFNIRGSSGRKLAESRGRLQEEKERQAQKLEAAGRLAGGMAHDFNNLLTALLGHCDFLEEQLRRANMDAGNLEQIRLAAERAGLLTKQLLAFGRKQMAQLTVLDLNELIFGIEQMLAVMLPKEIRLDVKTEKSPLWVKADRSQLEQVVLNLVLNARDATPRGGQITVRTEELTIGEQQPDRSPMVPAGDYVVLTVQDTGVGMDAETQSRMFEPFFSTKPKGEGVGLGLATTYAIIQQAGGYITVSSTLGTGTTLNVYLPRAQAEEGETVVTPSETPGGNETILVVDDEAAIRRLTGQFLGSLGYHVLEAGSGPEALRVAKEYKEPIALLLTDVVMPNMSGRELAFQLAPLRPEMKVLYMSGHSEEVIAHHGVLGDPGSFPQKPFRLADLAVKARALLDRQVEK